MKNLKNKKGFTLIELLAVIVILAVLLAIAIPSVSKYINSAKKSTYIANLRSYVKAARQETLINNSKYQLPINHNQATVISFAVLKDSLDNGGETSSYGGEFVDEQSYIVIVNSGEAEDPKYTYYVAAIDDKGYGVGNLENKDTTVGLLDSDKLKEANIVQLGTGNGLSYSSAATTLGVEVTHTYGYGDTTVNTNTTNTNTNTNGND